MSRSTDYPYGSAWWYARAEGPPWLSRGVVKDMVGGGRPYDPASYPSRVGGPDLAWVDEVVERRMRLRAGQADPLDDLVRASPAEVQSWMAMKAHLADGSEPGLVFASSGTVLRAAGVDPRGLGGGGGDPASSPVAVALLRLASGLRLEEIARMAGRSTTWVRARLGEHDGRMASDAGNARGAAEALARALREVAGSLGDPRVIPIVSPAEAPPPRGVAFPRAGEYLWQAGSPRP